jgi:biofilm PGA synthesis protein PgaA
MATHRSLALCAGLACVAPVSWSHAATPPADATRGDQLAEIGRYRDQGLWVDALAAIQRAQLQAPEDPLLYKLHVLTLSDIGNAHRAWQLYLARPALFDDANRERLEAAYMAVLIRWSTAYGETEDTRLAEAEAALAVVEDRVRRDGISMEQAPLRLRLDHLVLLNRLSRHSQVREEALALQREGVTLPDYVLPAVGDSMLATQHPDDAIPLLETAVRNDPSRYEARSELAYAYLENEQPGKALDYLEAWRKDEPAWRHGGSGQYANWGRYDADLGLAMIRAYTGDLVAAQRELEALVEVGPGNGGLQASLGHVYQMRGWPTRALERHRMAYTLDPRDISPRVGMHEAYRALQRDDLARPLHDELLARYPGEPSVARMDREWRAYRGWQVDAYAGWGRSSGGSGISPLGDDDGHYGLEVQSPVLDDRWRLFAFADRRAMSFQQQDIDPLWLGAGARYRFARSDAELAVLRPGDDIGGTGLRGGFGWQFNDRWHAGVSAARNDAEASMQARASAITADSMALQVDYQRDERTRLQAGAARFRYEDGNRRDSVNATIEQRLLTRPDLLIDGLGGLYASRGSHDDVPYFNPSRDRSVEIGVRIDQLLWRRYERSFRHRLTVSLGEYWQQGHGDALVPTAAYRHVWQLEQGRVLEYGVNWSQPVYDGQRERHVGFDATLHWGE